MKMPKDLDEDKGGKARGEVGESGLKGAVIPVDAFLGLVETNVA